uniref:Fer-1 like family member 4 n=1 Tax=Astyanax mexicanus TaxID=7994 RepID=A0A3B1KAX2_ASTMX
MSITVYLKTIYNLPGKYDRKVELSFRDFTHKTKILQCENVAIFKENFRWPHYGKIQKDEVLTISVYNSSRMFSNRLLGKLVVSLQHVVTAGRLVLREPLTDSNYSLTDIYVELDVRYHPLQGAAGEWSGEDFTKVEDRDESGLVIKNTGFLEPGNLRPQQLDRDARMLGRSLMKIDNEDGEDDDDDDYDDDYDFSDLEISSMTFTPILSRCRALSKHELAAAPKVKSFQVNVNVIEAQNLVGVNINPAVYITVGHEKKRTATQKSTNCPFYNENFMFEFQETQDVLFDKVIEISVVHKKTLAFLMTRIGTFKIDISTVYQQPDHRFYQKWAPITDPKDTRSGVKGYVKCTLSVMMKGDSMNMASLPPATSQNEDIERNLLLPKRMAAERPWAKFLLKIYRAEDLPSMNAGFLGSFSKMMGDKKVFIDPYVQVTFAGQQGETSVVSNTNAPEWNEQISFIEQFPPLARRIKVQILDDSNMGDVAVATHFLDLQQISNPNRNGFNPTFGPSWVNLYGSPQNSTLRDIHQDLNEGLSDGIFYRGRVQLSLSVEIYSSPTTAVIENKSSLSIKSPLSKLTFKRKSRKSREKSKESAGAQAASGPAEESEASEVPEAVTVEVEEIHPLPENFVGEKEEFLLFASFFEVTMIDPSIGSKFVTFELSIGNYGKTADVVVKSKKSGSREDLSEDRQGLLESDDELEREEPAAGPLDKSVTAPRRAQPTEYDGSFSCISLLREKPCIYVWNYFEDHTFRYHNCNWLSKMADRLEYGIDEVEMLLKRPRSNAKERLMEVLLEFVSTCKQYSSSLDRKRQARPNPLDKHRSTFIKRNIIILAKQALRVRRRVTRRTVRDKLADVRRILKRIHFLTKEPQSTLPDVFLWMMSGGKRVAYARIPAHTVLFSLVEEERGKDCGKVSTIYMKTPGGPLGEIFAKLEVYMWLGVTKYSKNCVTSLPAEFRPVYEGATFGTPLPPNMPPTKLAVEDSRYFQLRAHIYQARGIIAADDNGLSDPFTKVVFSTQCQVTQVTTKKQVTEKNKGPLKMMTLPLDVDPREPEYLEAEKCYIIPEGVRPVLKKFRIEVLYWGLRDLKRVNLFEVEKPQVRMECSGQLIESGEIESYKQDPNFKEVVKHFDVVRNDAVKFMTNCSIMHVVHKTNWPRAKKPVKRTPLQTVVSMDLRGLPLKDTKIPINPLNLVTAPLKAVTKKEEELEEEEPEKEELDWWSKYYASLAELEKEVKYKEEDDAVVVEIEPPAPKRKKISTLKLYKSELENEFSQFMDWLHTFPIYKGKANLEDEDDDDSDRIMGKYKGSFLIYPISSEEQEEEEDIDFQITRGIPKNSPIKVLTRVYVVKATNLAPADPNGKADPYVVVKIGQQQLDSKERYIPKQLHPVFGEVFELTVSFPLETELNIIIFDHDLVGSDDMIGETRIDLENRFYSRHRAGCGLALYYDKDGYNKWRDSRKPSAILADLCRKNGIPSPEYRDTEVKVLNKIFKIPNEAFPEELLKKNKKTEEDYAEMDEHRALSVLQRWAEMREFTVGACPLVPEHVEVRSLLNPEKPGLPQGYLHMWIDMFPVDVPPPPPVNIKPRLPVSYELRVIIWNTDDVVLDDVNPFTGEPSSDIYVKGWIKGLDDEKQETDVHFNSLTGEGNFNWRFVFHFDYLPTEKEIVYKKKESIFSLEESEFRQHAVLVLQVWDYDRIGSNDFLGSIELRLNDMVRAAKSSELCSVKMAKDKASPRFSIFRSKRMKGWWPLIKLKSQEDIEREEREREMEKKNKKKKKKKQSKRGKMKPEDLQFVDSTGNTFLLMGKVEAEFQLVTAEEAEKNPVGKARKEPEPLDKPNRPKTSFNWFVNPMKTFVFFIWKKYKKYIIVLVILAILALFLFLILYTLPTHISQLIVSG